MTDMELAASIAARERYIAAIHMHEAEVRGAASTTPDPGEYAYIAATHRWAIAVLARTILLESGSMTGDIR